MNIKPESKMLDEVRRWRREAYEARRQMSFEERAAEDRKLADELGLRPVPLDQLARPQPESARKAG